MKYGFVSGGGGSWYSQTLKLLSPGDLVWVKWLDTVAEIDAVNEVGLFGNQNTVFQPTTPKWRHTVERLKRHFSRWSQPPRLDPGPERRTALLGAEMCH